MPRLSSFRASRLLPVPPALLLVCLSGMGGCDAPNTAPPSLAASAAGFSNQLKAITGAGVGLARTGDGFSAILAEKNGIRPNGEVTLPLSGDGAVVLRPRRGGEVTVREVGLAGEGHIEERAVAYRGEGRSSYWSLSANGAEEWLLFEEGAARSDGPAAIWEVAGAKLVQRGEAVIIATESGARLVTVTAPAAFLADGSSAPVRLAVRGSSIELFVESAGQSVLVDPAWSFGPSMNVQRYRHTARKLSGGDVLVAGGVTEPGGIIPQAKPSPANAGVSPFTEKYTQGIDSWQQLPDMFTDRVEHAMVTQPGENGPDDLAFVIGGRNDFGDFLFQAEMFDGFSWFTTAGMWDARAGHTATRMQDNRVLVAGGYTYGGSGVPAFAPDEDNLLPAGIYSFLCSTEIYDPSANSGFGDWLISAPLSQCRANHTETLLPDGRVLVAGGEFDGTVLNSAEIYSPQTGVWTMAAPMLAPQVYHTATLLPNGRVLLAGGENAAGTAQPMAQVYDPATNTWALPVAPMMHERSHHAAVLLDDGRVLLSGGVDNVSITATAELFDPVTKAFTLTVPMGEPRAGHSLTLLNSGDVLVAGGETTMGNPPLSATSEVFQVGGGVGSPCGGVDDCSGGFCVDGVCCDTPCDQTCEACTVAARGGGGKDGICAPVMGGQDPADECAAQPVSTCGTTGACNGAGSCEIFAGGTLCKPGACMNNVAQAEGKCDGKGLCVAPGDKDCGSYLCNGGTCTTGCKSAVDCSTDAYCNAVGACLPKLELGATASDPAQCFSGFVADGVCCDTACDGACDACSAATGGVVDGQCAPLSGVLCDDGTACTKQDVCQNGVCVGMQPVSCPGDTGCTGGFACDPKTGLCELPTPPKNPGEACEDGLTCTEGETCNNAGVCSGGSAVVCEAAECKMAGACIEGTGCELVNVADFTPCTKDDNPCTTEVCLSGVCVKNNVPDLSGCPGGTCIAGTCVQDGQGTGGGSTNPGTGGGGAGTGGSSNGGSNPAGGSGSGNGGAGGSGANAANEPDYSLKGGACSAAPGGAGSGAGGLAGAAALAMVGLFGARRRRRGERAGGAKA
ncbi:MAG: kelch repeat-containing protein [Polyangiaceae bacterium]